LGYGVSRYIVEPTTSGAASWPFLKPVSNVNAGFSWPAFCAVIWVRSLKRLLA
jgi:hypothetical protein